MNGFASEGLHNGLGGPEHNSNSQNSFDDLGIDSADSLEEFMNLDSIDLAISHVSQLLTHERGLNGLVLSHDTRGFDDSLLDGLGSVPQVFEWGDHLKLLCQELSVLLSEDGHDTSNEPIIPEETARALVQWLLKFISEDKKTNLIVGNSLSSVPTSRTHLSSTGQISQTTSEKGFIPLIPSLMLHNRESIISTSEPHLAQTDTDYPSTTTSASAINEYISQPRTKSLPASAYLSSTIPRSFRDRSSTTPAVSAGGYGSDLDESSHLKRSIHISKDALTRIESMGLLGHEHMRDFHSEDRPHRRQTLTPEPWLSLENQTPVFKRRGSLKKITKAIGTKLKKAQPNDKVVVLGSNPSILVMDQPHRREFLSKDMFALQEWFVTLGLEEYCQKILNQRINSCTLLKLVIDGKLENVLPLSHPLHRKKLELALEETLKYGQTELTPLNYVWVLNWLEMNGLTEICPNFERARVDGRMLYMLTFDDLLLLDVEDTFYQLSLRSAIKALRLTSFTPKYLDSRELQDNCLYWSCPHVGDWLAQNLKLRNLEDFKNSGVNGALMMLEDTFTGNTLAEVLDIPKGKTYLRSVVKEEFMKVIGPHCAQHKLDKSKEKHFSHVSPSKFKTKKRSRGTEKKLKDGTRLLCPLIFEPNSDSPCFQGNLNVFQGLIDTYTYAITDLDTQMDRSEIDSVINSSQLSRVMTDEDGDILV